MKWKNVKSWTFFNILKYAKSLLQRLTWTKHSFTPGLRFLLWIITDKNISGSQPSFHPSPSQGFHIFPFTAVGTVWKCPTKISDTLPSMLALASALHSTPNWSFLRFYTALRSANLGTQKVQPNDLEGIWPCYLNTAKKKGLELICIFFC